MTTARCKISIFVSAVLLPGMLGVAQVPDSDALVRACERGDEAVVRRLLADGVDVNKSSVLDTPLTAAARRGHAGIVKLLLERGADRNGRFGTHLSLGASFERGRASWERCDVCHSIRLNQKKLGRNHRRIMQQPMSNGAAPTFKNLLRRVNEGGDGMPAYQGRPDLLTEQAKRDVIFYLMSSNEPRSGRTALELAEYECFPEAIQLLDPKPNLAQVAIKRDRPKITDYGQVLANFFDLRRSLCRIKISLGGNRAVIRLANEGKWSVIYLQERWNAADVPGWEPSAYDEMMVARVEALEWARRDAKSGLAILKAVVEDLALAAWDCRTSKAGMGRLVPISIETLKNMREDRGWHLSYKPVFFEFMDDVRPLPFPMLSSPSAWKLPPGRYIVWAHKDKLAANPVVITIGGGDRMQWQMPVP